MNEPAGQRGDVPVGRIRSLDSLRGLAALAVVLYHFSLVVPGVYFRLQAIWPLRPVIAGPTAVLVFFALSGFVLYLSFQRHDRDDWTTFAARRLARLYPPVAAAVLLSAGLYLLVRPGPLPALGGWLTAFSWTEPPGPSLLAGHLLLLDGDRFHMLDNPIWSLVVELRLSLLFPLVAAGIRRRPVATVIGCMVLSALSRHLLAGGHQLWQMDPVFTLQFLDLFAIGAAMAHGAAPIARALRRVPGLLVGAVTWLLLCVPLRFDGYAAYAGAVGLIAASLSYPALARVYATRPLFWLGERSFSLYLVHVPLLLAATHTLSGRVPITLILAGTLPVCLAGAELFWLAIERPSMRLSRHIGRRLSPAKPRQRTGRDLGRRGADRCHGAHGHINVYVHLQHGFEADGFRERFARGEFNDLTPYGFHLAEGPGVSVAFSRDRPGGTRGRLLRALNRRLRFGADHAWHNRHAIARSDVVWTMNENEAFALAALMMLRLVPRRPIVAAAIWLFNDWHRLPAANCALYRLLARYINVLTVHSAACLPVAAAAGLGTSVELSLFGINEESYPPLVPGGGTTAGPIASGRETAAGPIHVLAAGNDRTRDWTTLLEALGNDDRFIVSAWTPMLGEADTARVRNLRLPKPPTMAAIRAMYAEADVVIVPMVPNLFSGITVALEAAALGRPVISSDTGGVPSYFSPAEMLFVPPGDPAALRDAALAAQTPRVAALAAAAQARFGRGDYTTRAMIGRYRALTDRVLGREASPSRLPRPGDEPAEG